MTTRARSSCRPTTSSGGRAGHEERLRFWFDPTLDFHEYKFQVSKDAVRSVALKPFLALLGGASGSAFPVREGKCLHSFGLPSVCGTQRLRGARAIVGEIIEKANCTAPVAQGFCHRTFTGIEAGYVLFWS